MITMKDKTIYRVIKGNTYTLLLHKFALVIIMECESVPIIYPLLLKKEVPWAEEGCLYKSQLELIPDLKERICLTV